MSCYVIYSVVHFNHTSFVIWLFWFLNDFYFLHCSQCFSIKTISVALEKCDSIEWFFIDTFCMNSLLLYWVICKFLLLFVKTRKKTLFIYPCFSKLFIQCIIQYYSITGKNRTVSKSWNFGCFKEALPMFMCVAGIWTYLHILVSVFSIFYFSSRPFLVGILSTETLILFWLNLPDFSKSHHFEFVKYYHFLVSIFPVFTVAKYIF